MESDATAMDDGTTGIVNGGIASTPAPTCVNCGAEGRVIHQGVRDHEFGIAGSWSTRRCTNEVCRLCWIDPRPRDEELGKLYADYYTHAADDEDGELTVTVTPEPRGRRLLRRTLATAFFWRRDAFLAGDFYFSTQKPGRMLDVGCGNGEFVATMAAKGWDAVGIDFDEAAIRNARRYKGVEAHLGALPSQNFADDSFDGILLSNVIEHLPDPDVTFAECFRILRPGGRLVMLTPNTEALGHELFGRFWRGLEAPRHLLIFNCPTLHQYAQRAGFSGIKTFSTSGPSEMTRFIVERSQAAARAEGATPPEPSPRRMMLHERLLDTFGIKRGEWSVLIASKDGRRRSA